MPDSRSAELIFEAARNMSVPAERIAYLDGACGNDVALRRRVERLLAADAVAGSFLEHALDPNAGITGSLPPGEAATAAGRAMSADTAGARIGPYTLVEKIGEGGMGVVWSADQTEPVRRRVALKLIKPGMDTVQVIRRFETERQALALMDHTNIAKVFDAGTTVDHRPFFVMELIHGIPITSHCDQSQLSVRERLALFIPICHAIQHAHQKGIIHRDIKPSNVLVTMQDGVPIPKVIDFGVAKALHQRLTDTEVDTQLGIVVGTFEYMSPEQAKLSALDVDTRADIYALGVLLYELLTGSTPLDRRQLRQAALTECLRIIREVEPSKPSTKLSSSDDLPSIAAKRKLEPARLTRLVSGDLDWIAMKCLEKDRNRRYETANGLLMDIQRYLADEPVEACPPSRVYQFKKFVRRNKGTVIAATLVMAAIVTGAGVSIWQALRAHYALIEESNQRASAEREWKRAEANLEISQKLSHQLIDIAEVKLPLISQTETVRNELLDAALQTTRAFLAQKPDDPSLQKSAAKLHRYSGNVHGQVMKWSVADQSFRESIRLLKELSAHLPDDRAIRVDLCMTTVDHAALLQSLGRLKEANSMLMDAVDVADELRKTAANRTDFRRPLAMALYALALLQNERGQFEVASQTSDRAADVLRQIPKPSKLYRLMLAGMVAYKGVSERELGRPNDAIPLLDDAIAQLKNLIDTKIIDAANGGHWLSRAMIEKSIALDALERQDDARNLLTEAILRANKLVLDHPQNAAYQEWLAIAVQTRGRLLTKMREFEAARKDLNSSQSALFALSSQFPEVPSYHGRLGKNYLSLGMLGEAMGNIAEARQSYDKAAAALRRIRDIDAEYYQFQTISNEVDAATKRLGS